jgi:serine/threonine protein phosphatase PrpC
MPSKTFRPSELRVGGDSITGRCRELNEDSFGWNRATGVFVVADGCGATASGRIMADLVVETLLHGTVFTTDLGPSEMLLEATLEANRQIAVAAVGENQGSGATMAALRIAWPFVATLHIGDCRVYRQRQNHDEHGQIERLTLDHRLSNDRFRQSGETSSTPQPSVSLGETLTAMLVGSVLERCDVGYHRMRPGDLFLVCSDGVTGALGDLEIQKIISRSQDSLEDRAKALVAAADRATGHDNATALLVEIPSE